MSNRIITAISLVAWLLMPQWASSQNKPDNLKRPEQLQEEQQEATPVEAPQSTTLPEFHDKYASVLTQARNYEAKWQLLHEDLLTGRELATCPADGMALLDRAKEALGSSLNLYRYYYESHKKDIEQLLREMELTWPKINLDRSTFESRLEQLRQQLADVNRRRKELPLGEVGPEAYEKLDQIRSNLQTQIDRLNEGLQYHNEAIRDLQRLRRLLRERISTYEDMIRAVRTEATIWDAYYKSVEVKLQLSCLNQDLSKPLPRPGFPTPRQYEQQRIRLETGGAKR